ncbi:MAG: hypothetical protein Q8K97_08450 [Pseudohongiella sp.]|nr:hypothetical protein [Pseudohongiella sp.]
MGELEAKVSSLIADYLVKSNRDHKGSYDHYMLATSLLSMLSADSMSKVFEIKDSNYSIDEYNRKLNAILQNIRDHSISWSDYTKQKIFGNALETYFSRITSEIEASATARESWRLKQKIIDLEAQLEYGKPANSVNFLDKLGSRVNIPYLILLCLSAVLIGGLTLVGLSADMTVNVEFNIGEILGALLIGTGVAAAGVSYATKARRTDTDQNEG